ncbi:MAG TPA: hypothetical protein VMS76_11635 [Planctomycetota bacterium]|nr:hypothetical protein [Planctomycetota bacterium]
MQPLECLLLAAFAGIPLQDAPLPAQVELSSGPAARAFAGYGPLAEPRAFEAAELPPEAGAAAWSTSAPWLAWAELAREEAGAAEADARRRARLALVAWSQRRSDDAWEHLAHTTADPGWMAAALPYLLPGVPLELLPPREPLELALPDGVTLAPALPPPDRPAREVLLQTGRPANGSMRISGLRIGSAQVAIGVSVQYDGVQVDLEHLGGGPARLALVVPEPPDFEIASLYVDWTPRERAGGPLQLALEPGAPTLSVFGRFRPRRLPWPMTLPERPSTALAESGLRLVLAPSDPDAPRLRAFARALSVLLASEVAVETLDPAHPPEPFPGITLQLVSALERERKLRGLVSLAERCALSR